VHIRLSNKRLAYTSDTMAIDYPREGWPDRVRAALPADISAAFPNHGPALASKGLPIDLIREVIIADLTKLPSAPEPPRAKRETVKGSFACRVVGCGALPATEGEARHHQTTEHKEMPRIDVDGSILLSEGEPVMRRRVAAIDCEICGRCMITFERPGSNALEMEKHVNSHIGNRAFVCTEPLPAAIYGVDAVCPASFTCQAHLGIHIKACHR